MPITGVNPRWPILRMHILYEGDIFTKVVQPTRSIWGKMRIDLGEIARAPNLWASFGQYQLGWMTRPQGSKSQALVVSSTFPMPPQFL